MNAKQQIQDSRHELENAVTVALHKFTKDTGLTVYDLDIEIHPSNGDTLYAVPDIDLKA
jgi:hypothetical protein